MMTCWTLINNPMTAKAWSAKAAVAKAANMRTSGTNSKKNNPLHSQDLFSGFLRCSAADYTEQTITKRSTNVPGND